MKRTWSNEQLQQLKKEYPTTSTRILAERFGKTEKAVITKARIIGVKKENWNNRWTPDQDEQLTKLYPNNYTSEVATIIGLRLRQVRNRAYFLGLKKSKEWIAEAARKNSLKPDHGGRKFLFKKGQASPKKGKKLVDYMSKESIAKIEKTQFKKGHRPSNTLYDGAIVERMDSKGLTYKWIRIAQSKWVPYQRYLWEQAYGSIPEGYNIQFKDKNPLNCTLDNLYMVSHNKQMIDNSGSLNLSDGMVAFYLAGDRGRDKKLIAAIKQNKPLLELKRQQLKLNREINKQHEGNRE